MDRQSQLRDICEMSEEPRKEIRLDTDRLMKLIEERGIKESPNNKPWKIGTAAKAMGMADSTLRSIFDRGGTCQRDTAYFIADFFGVSPAYLDKRPPFTLDRATLGLVIRFFAYRTFQMSKADPDHPSLDDWASFPHPQHIDEKADVLATIIEAMYAGKDTQEIRTLLEGMEISERARLNQLS